MAQPYADALGSIDDITVIDRDGASRLSGQVTAGVQELGTLLKAQTGIDLLELLRGAAAGAERPPTAPAAATATQGAAAGEQPGGASTAASTPAP
jgi:flotillin